MKNYHKNNKTNQIQSNTTNCVFRIASVLLTLIISISPLTGKQVLARSVSQTLKNSSSKVNLTGKTVLPLGKFIKLVCQRHPRFQELLAEKASVKYSRLLKTPETDLLFNITSEYGVDLTSDSNNSTGVTASLSKLFLNTGTSVETSYTALAYDNTTGTDSDAYVFEAAIILPILNNSFGYKFRLAEQIYDLESEIARYQIIEAYEEFLSVLYKAYFQWYANYARLKTARSTHRENLSILKDMKARLRSNIALPVDVNKIRLKVMQSEADLLIIRNHYQESTNFIRYALHEKNSEDDLNYLPQLPKKFTIIPPSFNEEIAVFETTNRTFSLLNLLKEKAKLDLKYHTDALLPFANATVRYKSESTQFGFTSATTEDVYIGISLTYPLGNTKARARKEQASIYLKRTKNNQANKSEQLKTDLKNTYINMQTIRDILQLTKSQLRVANKVRNAERKYFQRGRISLNDYILAIREVESLKFRIDDLTVERDSLFVEWLRLSDQLIKKIRNHPLADIGM